MATITVLLVGVAISTAYAIGAVMGRRDSAREQLDELRARRLFLPPEFHHMASLSITAEEEILAREALSIARGETFAPLMPAHVAVLLALHADAVAQYDKLGDRVAVQTRQLIKAKRERDLLAWTLRREIEGVIEADRAPVSFGVESTGATLRLDSATPLRVVSNGRFVPIAATNS